MGKYHFAHWTQFSENLASVLSASNAPWKIVSNNRKTTRKPNWISPWNRSWYSVVSARPVNQIAACLLTWS